MNFSKLNIFLFSLIIVLFACKDREIAQTDNQDQEIEQTAEKAEIKEAKKDSKEEPSTSAEETGEPKIDPSRMNGDWFIYIEDAYAMSEYTGKPIMANFTGSDWCGWCIRLKNEVFKTAEFKEWAADNIILLELDFPRKKALPEDLRMQNASLQQAFKVSGYPTLWIFNLDFNDETKQFNIQALGKTGYVSGGPSKWIQQSNMILQNQ